MTNREFQETVVNASNDGLRRLAMRLTHNDYQDAEDLIGETVLKALTNRDKFRYQQNLHGWLATMMRNIFLNQYKRKHHLKIRVMATEPTDFVYLSTRTVDNYGLSDLELADVKQEVDKLSDTIREPFMMHFKGYSYKEIAGQLDLSVGAVKTRIFNARKKLRDALPNRIGH